MYNENDYNKYQGGGSRQDQNTDSDLDYTEGSYSDSTSSRQTDSRYSGYHDPDIPAMPKAGSGVREHIRTGNRTEAIFRRSRGETGKRAVTWLKGQRESRRRELFLAV